MLRRIAPLLICIAAAISAGSETPASAATRHVVMLFDERLELPGLASIEADFVDALVYNSPDKIHTYREPMDLSRFDSEPYRTLLKDFLTAKYANRKIDVVVAVFGPALEFLLKHGDSIFPGVPIVFFGVDRHELGDRSLPSHVRGVLLNREFAPTLELALKLHPGTKRIFVVSGTSGFDARLLKQARQEFSAYENRLAFTYLSASPLQDTLTTLKTLPPQSLVLFTTLFRDGAGEAYISHDVLSLVSAAANVPVYGFLDQYLGRGLVGGSLYSGAPQAKAGARLVLQILANTEPSGPSLSEITDQKVQFDWRQMLRWGIQESSLPAGSEIRFRDPTLLEDYRNLIIAGLAVLLLQAALISWLVYENWRRRAAESASLQLSIELARVNRLAVAGELTASIAHEIRQPLSAVVVAATAGLNWLNKKKPDLNEARIALENAVEQSHRADDVIKGVGALFRKEKRERKPVNVSELVEQVLAVTASRIKSHGIVLEANLTRGAPPVVLADPIQLQQVILNLVINAVEALRDSAPGARTLQIETEVLAPATAAIRVRDSGPSVDPKVADKLFQPFFTTKPGGMGMGLPICRKIIEAHGGSLTAIPNYPRGMEFQVVLPLHQSGAAARIEGGIAAPAHRRALDAA